jgi:hypothetical protein
MKFFWNCFCICLILNACKEQKSEVVDFDSLSKPAQERPVEAPVSTKPEQVNFFDTLSSFSQQLVDSLAIDHQTIHVLDTLIFPDRFGAKLADKWYAKSANDSVVFMQWKFQKAEQTTNTFFNWLDCYGARCKAIEIGDEVSFSKRGVIFMIGSKELIFIETFRKFDADKWISSVSNIAQNKTWKYIVTQQPKAKATWQTMSETGGISPLK